MMVTLGVFLLIVSALGVLIWTSRHAEIARERRDGLLLSDAYQPADGPRPRVSVLVAAKDEEANIETCVRSLATQDYPDYEIIAVNDRSADATGDILDRLAAEFEHVQVIHVESLPDGWKGKNHAMHLAAERADGELLLLTDADCEALSPRALSVGVGRLLETNSGMVSVLPVLQMRGFWENVVQPVCTGVMMIWFKPQNVNEPGRQDAYANGAFMLLRRTAYDAIGGHDDMRGVLQEDFEFARRVKDQGLGLHVVRNTGLYGVRMYTSLGQIFGGWTRIFYGSFGTLSRLALSLLAVVIMGFLPYVAGLAGLALALAGAEPGWLWWSCGLTGVAASALQLSVLYRFYAILEADQRFVPAYAVGCVITCASLVAAMFKHRRGARVTWKGTAYSSS